MAGLKKLLKRHGGKKSTASKEDVRSLGDEVAFGYSITKEKLKDLPKLHKAVWNVDIAKVKQLCKKGDINQFDKENRTPLHLAAACGLDEITQFLLVNKAKTNLCDNDGRTPLMKAVECSHLGCIQLLLENNADVNVTDKNSSSPLHLAAANNLINIATRLLEKGLSVNVSDKEGFTSLHVASSLGNQDFVLYLLNRNADVDVTDAHGRTPLMTAAADGHVDIVKMLIQHNADVTLKDFEGWKAADHAVMNGIHSCAKIIDDHEAKQKQGEPKKQSPKPTKKPNINEVLRTSSPVNDDLGFSFGGPAADKASVDGNLRSEASTSRHSDEDDSWASSSVDENSEINKQTSRVSLAAALKKVDSNVSETSNKSPSRIPVRSPVKTASPEQASPSNKVKSPAQTSSRIPRPVSSKPSSPESGPTTDVSSSHSPQGHSAKRSALSPTASVKSTGSLGSHVNSPRNSIARSNPQETSRIVSPTESMKSGSSGARQQIKSPQSGSSMPMEYLKPTEENIESDQSNKSKVDGVLDTGYSPSFLSPQSDKSNRNLADELGLSLESSDENDDFDDSVMSGEVALENSMDHRSKEEEKPKSLTSTTKQDEKQSKESKNPAAYLGLDLGSSISSVSDPDISGILDDNEKRNTKKEKVGSSTPQSRQTETKYDNEDTDSNWDSSEDFLPSDNDKSGRTKSSNVAQASYHNKELKAAVEKRRETLKKAGKPVTVVNDSRKSDEESTEEDENDGTESESEWAQEREEQRRKELEKIKESALAKMKMEEARQKEVEEKLGIEMENQKEEKIKIQKQKEEEMKIQKEEEMKIQKRKEEEMKVLKQKEDQARMKKEKDEKMKMQREKEILKIQKQKEEERIRMEKQKEESRRVEWEKQQQQKELELAESIKKELEEEIRMNEDNLESDEVESYNERRPDPVNKGKQQKTLRDFEEEGSSQWDSTEVEISDANEEDSDGSLETNDTLEDVKERKLEKNRELKDQEKLEDYNNNKNVKEPDLVEEEAYIQHNDLSDDAATLTDEMESVDVPSEQRGALEDNRKVTGDARRIQNEEDALLEAYKVRQEEMLEQERRMEEELARKELERVEGLRVELERQKEQEMARMVKLERQRKEREVALQKEQEEREKNERIEKERQIKELKKKQQDEMKRVEMEHKKKIEENKARVKNLVDSSSELERLSDPEIITKSQAESLLTEKHREFVDEAANSAAIGVQKVQNREKLADKSREIKQRQVQAKADLNAIRLQNQRLTEPSKFNVDNMRESSRPKSPLHDMDPDDVESVQADTSPPSQARNVTSDWSTSSEDDIPLPRVKTPLSSGDGGLGSSLSPGLQSAIRPSLMQSLPLLSSSPAVLDSSPLTVQLKNSLRDTKRQVEKSHEKLSLAETKVKQLQNHTDELQTKLEEVIQQKSVLERDIFDITEDNRVLKHDCSRALEDKNISDALVDTFKQQLSRSEEKLNREINSRRNVEEVCKQLEVDRLNLENTLRHMTEEQEELKRALEREHEQCRLKDELYNEQKKQIEEVISESQKVSQHRADVLTKLESVDENRKNMEANTETLRKELIHAKSEVSRLNSQLETVTKFSQSELQTVKAQLVDQTEKARRLEDTLAKVRSEYDLKLSEFQSLNADQQNKLESERSSKHALQSEVAVSRSRLETTENERSEANKTRIETEKQLQNVREDMYRTKSILEKELSTLRENHQLSTLKLNTSENKVSALEAELQTANIMLAERSSQMSINIRDIDHKQASVTKLESDLRSEKEANTRLAAQLDASSEKLRNLETESLHLRRQLEVATDSVRKYESSSQETQNKLHSTITEIKTDFEKTKGKMSTNERRLADAVKKYKEEIQHNFTKQQLQDENIRRLQQELVEASRKQSVAEASLEVQLKARVDLEEERDHLRQTLRDYEGQMKASISETHLVNGHASVLLNELDHSRQVSNETSQRLASTSYDLQSLGKTKDDVDNTLNPAALEGDIRRLKMDRVKLEATLNEEKAKTEILLREIRDSNEGRTQLETFLSQLKSSNIELTDQLQAESLDKSQHAREAEEAKGLWESEVRARSKLGAKIIEMENKVNEAKAEIEEEKKKTRKALESRKVLLGKLEVFEKRSDQHQKEVQALKTQIKAYKRRVKECESTERRLPVLQGEFNREIQQYEGNITSLRNQLRDLNEKLRQEGDMRVLAERKGQQQEKDFLLAKSQTKEQSRQLQKLEKLNRKIEEEMERLKENYDNNYVDKTQLERIKMDIEAKSRIELNRKLADVNAHLEEQALAREALEKSRNEQEMLKSREMENTISKLKRENETYRSNLHKIESEVQTKQIEAERLKDMYVSESKRKQKLDDLLFQEREKSAESKALLNLERSRSGKILGNSHLNMSFLENSTGFTGISKNESMGSKSPHLIYSQPKEKLMESVDKELSKSIQRQLDTISTSSPVDVWANKEINMTSSPLASSTNQYMETLKRNYFV